MIPGKEKVAKILSKMKSGDSSATLNIIASKDEQLARELKELMFTFEDILDLESKDLELLHKKIDTKDLLLSMKGASDELKEKLLSGMSENKRQILKEEFELLGKVKKSDVESARQKVMDVVRELLESGKISLDDEWVE